MKLPADIERIALLGWHVYPASPKSRAACFTGATDAATTDLDTIAMWCREYAPCNWRVVFGPSKLWGLDVDTGEGHAHDGVGNFAEMFDRLPPAPRSRSGGGGYCVFFRHQGEPIIGDSGHPVPGVDPRRGRQSVTIPPSVHVRWGTPYAWIVPPWEVEPPVAPRWLLDAVRPAPVAEARPIPAMEGEGGRKYAIAALRHAIGRVATAASGNANNTLNREAYALAKFLREGLVTESEIRDCLMAGARARNIPVSEATATIDSGIRSRLRA